MQKVIVINAKGGCGKSTIATNIASFYAARGLNTALFDHDPQGSSMQWLRRRPQTCQPIYGVAAYEQGSATTRAWQLRVPAEIARVVTDTPAGLKGYELGDFLKDVDKIIVPVLPSAIDINATANFMRELFLVAKVKPSHTPVYVVANRIKARTKSFQGLERFLEGLNVPVAAYLRDTVNYVQAAEQGVGVHELPLNKVERDIEAWRQLMNTLDPEIASHSCSISYA